MIGSTHNLPLVCKYHTLINQVQTRCIISKILHILVMNTLYLAEFYPADVFTMALLKPVLPRSCYSVYEDFAFMYKYKSLKTYILVYTQDVSNI
jgi:hypothetical protein